MDQPTPNPPAGGRPQEEPAPFEMPPNITPPEPMGGRPEGKDGTTSPRPGPEMPKKPLTPILLMIFLVIILILGVLFFASYKGWIAIFGLDKFFAGSRSSPSPSPSVSISPQISPNLSPTVTSSGKVISNVNDETRKKDLGDLKTALKRYYAEKSSYPQSPTMIKTSDKTSILYGALVPAYLEKLPDDPLAPQYYYGYKSDGQSFELTAALEDKSDPSGNLSSGGLNIYKITNSSVE